MKRVVILVSVASLAIACNNQPKATEPTTTAVKVDKSIATLSIPADVPFKAIYTNWVPGDAGNIKIMLDMYKNWDDGKIDLAEKIFADTVTFDDASGHRFTLTRPHLIDSLNKWRAYYAKNSTDIVTALSLHSPDMNEDWVCIWGHGRWTDKKGKSDSSFTNDNWRFQNGKVVYGTTLEQKGILPPK